MKGEGSILIDIDEAGTSADCDYSPHMPASLGVAIMCSRELK